MSQRICLALDLAQDADLIAEYEAWHTPGRTPPAIIQSLRDGGIEKMEIYRAGERMFMILEVSDSYDGDAKARADAANPAVVEWGERMKRYQRPVPAAGPDGTWIVMDRIFHLADHAGLKER
jgi:L-rhamnose mutarotase